ncbi:hypothetical protein [Salimicrobium halophilum]|uniref:Lipoprotein n=1 Tax=Salimicrobium halophilum TaxID=86666 RepID=A0A1G8R8P2_9BACI|nr:hypothetical protein [Salimicrobium halophilum]SDJ13337.1 hypothetical protein SAMN04490247_0894 [Salimicrobium halophilum]
MRLKYVILAVLTISVLVSCQKGETDVIEDETFPTEKEAIHHFLDENPRSDVERIDTTDKEEVFLVRSGNDQYSLFGMKAAKKEYSIVKLTATLSLHNTAWGAGEMTTAKGKDYTFLIGKKGKQAELDPAKKAYIFSDVYAGDGKVSLNKGHLLEEDKDSAVPESVIETTETISSLDGSS